MEILIKLFLYIISTYLAFALASLIGVSVLYALEDLREKRKRNERK